jgi:AmmeMemoRadiSam system protein B
MQLPFLQFISKSQSKNFKIVPIIFSHLNNYKKFPASIDDIKYLIFFSDVLRKTIYQSKVNACIVVSGDFTHYGIYHNYAPFKNNVIERIKKIDKHSFKLIEDSNSDGFFNYANKTTYCCTYPVYVLLNTINSNKIELLNYYIHSLNKNKLVNTFDSFSFK